MRVNSQSYIHDTALVRDSELGNVKLFRNSVVLASVLGDGCTIGDDTNVERCQFENNVIINRRSFVNDSKIGMFSYAGINLTMNWTILGRFCSIGRNVDIGGFDHEYHKVTTMPHFRWNQMSQGGGKIPDKMINDHCKIGNDVWIAAGAHILHKVTIGDGAIIGAGAVVTHDVPPYAIAVGVPAKIIGYRFEEKYRKALLELKWWNWPLKIIKQNMDMFMDSEVNEKTIKQMKEINNNLIKESPDTYTPMTSIFES